MDKETRRALAQVEDAIGALSDLRHGKFAQTVSGEDIVEQVIENLKKLEAACVTPAG
jgi:centromere-localized protein 2